MFQNAVLVWVPKYRKLGRYVAHIGPTKMGGDTKGAVRQERKLCGGGPVAPRRCSCGRRCQRAWASRCCSGGQGPRAAALAWLEGQARRGFSLKPAHGARVKARRPPARACSQSWGPGNVRLGRNAPHSSRPVGNAHWTISKPTLKGKTSPSDQTE